MIPREIVLAYVVHKIDILEFWHYMKMKNQGLSFREKMQMRVFISQDIYKKADGNMFDDEK